MILLGMTGPIGHGKTTFANALSELVPGTRRLESSLVIAEIVDAFHASLKDIPDHHDIDTINICLRSLPAILLQTLHIHTTFEDIKLDPADVASHPGDYQKLFLHIENLNRRPDLAKTLITPDNKESFRPILQWFGGYLVNKVDPGIWYHELVRRTYEAKREGCELCIVGGLRFPCDATLLRHAEAIIVKVYRPGHLQNDMLDPTERERGNIVVDTTVSSNGSVDDVKQTAIRLLADIKANNLQATYQTIQ